MLLEPDAYLTLNRYLKLVQDKETPPFNTNIMALVHHVCDSLLNARKGISKINLETQEGKELIEYEGYTGTRTRHFYNNICCSDKLTGIKYLEIGTWNGSSSISAIYGNKLTALFIDNWCQFGGDPEIFKNNLFKYGNDDSSYYLLEQDCWKVNLDELDVGPFNIYLFDGDHAELDHFESLRYYYPVLEDIFIFMVDDWNWPNVRDGTMRAIDQLNLHVLFRHEEFVSEDELEKMPEHIGKKTWWNGIGIFILSKSPKKLIG
jgi:hypothetical protein